MKYEPAYLSALLIALLFISGCCSSGKGDCEEGVTVKILYDTPKDLEDMTVRWTSEKKSGKAVWRPKEDRFFIDQVSDVLGDEFVIEVVFDNAVISQETYKPKWQSTVCGKAEGASWCTDDTYEWAEIEIDLRSEEEQ